MVLGKSQASTSVPLPSHPHSPLPQYCPYLREDLEDRSVVQNCWTSQEVGVEAPAVSHQAALALALAPAPAREEAPSRPSASLIPRVSVFTGPARNSPEPRTPP